MVRRRRTSASEPFPLYFFDSMTLPPFFMQSSLLVSTTPLPLQAFCPAQLLPAPAHEPCPLHALMPAQDTVSPVLSPAARATTAPLRMRLAAALAISTPVVLLILRPPW